MKQEDKDLVLRDLSARLPYGVICTDSRHGDSRITEIDIVEETVYCEDFDEYVKIKNIKPFLRPMSSMTEEEYLEYFSIKYGKVTYRDKWKRIDAGKYYNVGIIPIDEYLDWLNAHHFDYRGLIEKGLAIAVTKENNPYEEINL